MCRYAFAGPYRDHYACFRCRKSFKWPHDRYAGRTEKLPEPKCPQCAGAVEAMGLDFKAPPQKAVDQWKKVRILADHGIRYSSCGCGPGFRPAELRDVWNFIESRLPDSEGERLLGRIAEAAKAHHGRTRAR